MSDNATPEAVEADTTTADDEASEATATDAPESAASEAPAADDATAADDTEAPAADDTEAPAGDDSEAPADDAPASAPAASAPEVPSGPYPPLTPGDRVSGEVVKLVEFGAFVDVLTVEGTVTGLVHVSEVDRGFVENIYAHLSVGEQVTVKVVSVGDDGKIGLSIKQADPEWEDEPDLDRPRRSTIDKDFDRRLRKFMHGSQSIQGEVRRQKRGRLGND